MNHAPNDRPVCQLDESVVTTVSAPKSSASRNSSDVCNVSIMHMHAVSINHYDVLVDVADFNHLISFLLL